MTSSERPFKVSGMQNPIIRVLEVFVVGGACAIVGVVVKDRTLALEITGAIAALASQYGVSLPKFGEA